MPYLKLKHRFGLRTVLLSPLFFSPAWAALTFLKGGSHSTWETVCAFLVVPTVFLAILLFSVPTKETWRKKSLLEFIARGACFGFLFATAVLLSNCMIGYLTQRHLPNILELLLLAAMVSAFYSALGGVTGAFAAMIDHYFNLFVQPSSRANPTQEPSG